VPELWTLGIMSTMNLIIAFLLAAAFLSFGLGLRSFTRNDFPLTGSARLTGAAAKWAGLACFAFSLICLFLFGFVILKLLSMQTGW